MKYCTNCGHPLNENGKVCLNCGKIVENKVTPKEKKQNYFWIVSLVFGMIAFVSLITCFFLFEAFYLAIPTTISAIIFGILGFFQKNRLNLIGLILGIFVFVCFVILFIIGVLTELNDNIDGNWFLEEDSNFQIRGQDEVCYWYFGADYYKGICSYEKAEDSEAEVPNFDENTFVLYMQLDTVKYDGEVYTAEEFLEAEQPYFVFYLYLDQTLENGVFYNPTSDSLKKAYKQAE